MCSDIIEEITDHNQ